MEDKESSEQQKSPSKDEIIASLTGLIKTERFFSNQTEFNATIWEGMRLILTKLNKIEEEIANLAQTLSALNDTADIEREDSDGTA